MCLDNGFNNASEKKSRPTDPQDGAPVFHQLLAEDGSGVLTEEACSVYPSEYHLSVSPGVLSQIWIHVDVDHA